MAIRDCDEEIFLEGEAIALLQGKPVQIESWVRSVAKKAKACLDWQVTGYVAQLLHLGDIASRIRVEVVLDELSLETDKPEKNEPEMSKILTKRFALNHPGLRRDSVRKTFPSITRT